MSFQTTCLLIFLKERYRASSDCVGIILKHWKLNLGRHWNGGSLWVAPQAKEGRQTRETKSSLGIKMRNKKVRKEKLKWRW